MKRGKKLFTYLLVLVMLLANTVTGVAAELDEPLQEATQIVHEDGSGLLSEGGLLEASDAVADSSYDHSHDTAIVAAMEKLQDTIDVTGYGLTRTNVGDVIHGILNMNPQLFYVSGGFRYYLDNQSNVTKLIITYNYTKAQITSMKAEIDAEVAKMEAAIDTTGLSDVEIALAYHDYLVTDVTYDYENYLSNSLSSDDYNIYGTLVKKKAVCQGYALTFMYLMKRQNIVCGYVSSEAANHAWNAVYLNNQWYHMDATWDDPTWDNLGRVKHTYFMISDATLLSLDSDRTDYVTSVPYGYTYTKATDSRYESGFWSGVQTYMYPYNGNWYYLDGAYVAADRSAKYQISKYNYASQTTTCLYGPAYAKWTTADNGVWTAYFGRMAARNGVIYFSTPTTIEQYSISTGTTKTIFTLPSGTAKGTYIYGLGFIDGDLCYVTADTANYKGQETYNKVSLCTSHVYGAVQTINPTYEQAGKKYHVCKTCGYSEDIENLPKLVKVSTITIVGGKKTMTVGESYTVEAVRVVPDNATNKEVTWSSSNPSVASIDTNGTVTAKAAGTATITATAKDGQGAKDSFVMTVKKADSSETPDPDPNPNPDPNPDPTPKPDPTPTPNPTPTPDPTPSQPVTPAVTVRYTTHVQTFGWQAWKYNGQMSGTSGQAKRLEGINIRLSNQQYSGDIVYTTHVQSYGWQGNENNQSTWRKNGVMSGTSGEAKRLEAIRINLTGEMAKHYDIYYRVHAQSFGWLDWAKNGAPSGTAGYAKRLEGIQIILVPKGQPAPAKNYGGITSVRASYIAK